MQNRPGEDGFTLKVVLPNNDLTQFYKKKFNKSYFTIFWSKRPSNTKEPRSEVGLLIGFRKRKREKNEREIRHTVLSECVPSLGLDLKWLEPNVVVY